MAGIWDWLARLFRAPRPAPAAPPRRPAAAPAPPAPKRATADRYAPAPGIAALSPDEFRRRALAVRPWTTAFIGRVDLIPPQSDVRTALIDRGLVLTGRLTEAELAEIHEVGDLWLEHHGVVEAARLAGRTAGEAAVQELRAERAANKEARRKAAADARAARAAAVRARRESDIVFVGRGVSAGLADRRAHLEKLEAAGLPVLATPAELALFLGVSIPQLRWLAFHQEAATRVHYVSFTVPKRSGGTRTLSAPHRKLATVQQRILAEILARVPLHPAAHGFVPGHSTLTGAEEHVGKTVLVNLDVKDFFPSITLPRVRGAFRALGYSPAVASLLALLCTESPRAPMKHGGATYHVATGPRALPQGACTSPALSNLVARRLDARLAGYARAAGWTYTRYADDLCFSAGPERRQDAPRLIGRVRTILESESFQPHPDKTRVSRKGGRQMVTGIVVNDKPGLRREEVRRIRAILHRARTEGLEAQNRDGHPRFAAWLRGKLAYLHMIDPDRAAPLLRELDALTER